MPTPTRSAKWPARLPLLPGKPIEILFSCELPRANGQEVHAATDLRKRLVLLDAGLRAQPAELRRIATHELFHFAWARLGNRRRLEFERIVAAEWTERRRGELGWSAEWRKNQLRAEDVAQRSRRWREYLCESFCDTAAWLYSNVRSHGEFTLSAAPRRQRRQWFERTVANGPFPI